MRYFIRSSARIVLGGLSASVVILGVSWGLSGATTPVVSEGETFGDWIVVRTTNPNSAPVSLEWVLMSNGRVEIALGSVTQPVPPATPPALDSKVVLYLYCGARLHFPTEPDRYMAKPISVVEQKGTGSCGDRGPVPALGRPRQVVTLSPHDIVSGNPYGAWSAEGAGQRIARTPRITPLRVDTKFWDVDYYPPALESMASAVVTSRQREFVDLVLPTSLANGTVSYDDDRPYNLPDDTAEYPAARFTSTFAQESSSSNDDPGALHSGTVRLIDSAGQQRAQLLTLGAGVLLGVGASLMVEGLFHLARKTDARERQIHSLSKPRISTARRSTSRNVRRRKRIFEGPK